MSSKNSSKKFSEITSSGSNYRCFHSHPAVRLGKGRIFGGSCHEPVPEKDIYVGLDWKMHEHVGRFPWEVQDGPIVVHFPLIDMQAPDDVKNFKALINWLVAKLKDGKEIHVGCMGGHGRTGLLLAAVTKVLMGETDAITWVRENYCKKAVESKTQVNFLVKEFGIKAQKGSKEYEGSKVYPVTGWTSGKNTWPSERLDYQGNIRSYGTTTGSERFHERYVKPTIKDSLVRVFPVLGVSIWDE